MQEKKFVLKALKKIAAVGTGVAMLGATLTGALALDLADYPSPFVKDGVYDTSNVFVVGDNALAADTLGALDIAAGLQFEAKTKVSSGGTTVSVVGGESKQIPLGFEITNSNATEYFDTENQDDEVSSLLDDELSFNGENIKYEEVLRFNSNAPVIKTGVDDDDYESNVYMEVSRNAIEYRFKFKESINLSEVSSSTPLDIDFLGQKLKITDVGSNSITAITGNEYLMKEGESVTVDGKTVTLVTVGSNSVYVDVDGTTVSVSTTAGSTGRGGGLEITMVDSVPRDTVGESMARLAIGSESSNTYNDGDEYIGEDENDPDWRWVLSVSATDSADHYMGVKNDFIKNKLADEPPTVGECINLPNNYVSVCLDSLSVADDDYMSIDMSIEEEDLSASGFTNKTDANVLVLEAGESEGFKLVREGADASNSGNYSSSTKYTDTVYLAAGLNTPVSESVNGTAVCGTGRAIELFFKDPDVSGRNIRWWGTFCGSSSGDDLLEVNYGDTKADNMKLKLGTTDNSSTSVVLTWAMQGKQTGDLANDNIQTTWNLSSDEFDHLGPQEKEADSTELVWGGSTNYGEAESDLRTHYGVIIKDPKSNGGSDEVHLLVPSDQVFANVVLKGTSTEVSEGGASYVPQKVSVVSKLASEVTEPTNYNLILVGGPCANPLVETVFGMTCADWPYAEGEGVVKLAENGDKVAMLVAGTTAEDTRRAAKAIANYKDYSFSGTEKVVKGTSMSDITVE